MVSGGAATRSFTHDAAGNLVADARPATAFAYGYDANGGLKSVTRDGTLWASYVSNAFRQRVSRTLTSASGAAAQTHYVYDRDGRLLAEADGTTGQTVREYVWLDDLPIAVIDVSAGNVLYYVVTDHLYRPVELRNAQGSAVWQAAYEPFGAVHAVTGSLTLDARFPGQWFDLETGLHYNWHRHYDPTLGRYIEPDPIGLAGGSNRYAYAMSSPLMFIDSYGLLNPVKFVVAMTNTKKGVTRVLWGSEAIASGTPVGIAGGPVLIASGGTLLERAYQQLKEAYCEEWTDASFRNLLGLLPYGQHMDDPSEPTPMELYRTLPGNYLNHLIELGTLF